MNVNDTICAVATAPGGAARGIVRVSGPRVPACLANCFSASEGEPSPGDVRHATVIRGRLRLDGIAASLPCELHLWPGRRSYTREPLAELHTVGSPPLLEAVVRAVCAGDARPARPGEFTLRAFLAGRLDLVQAEAVLGVIDARGEHDLATALAQLAGGISSPLSELRGGMLDLLAHLEAGLDFVEEDIEFIKPAELRAQLADALDRLSQLSSRMTARGTADDATPVVLAGRPNAGKSCLFNALIAGADGTATALDSPLSGAIVSPVAGTTRDYLSARIELQGVAVDLIDTAGIDDAADALAVAARRAGQAQQERAAVRLVCIDASRPMDEWEREQVAAAREGAGDLVSRIVLTKCDLADGTTGSLADGGVGAIATSARTGAGLAALRAAIVEAAVRRDPEATYAVAGTAARCGDSLRRATAALERALDLAAAGREELVAADVRLALDEVGQVVGAVYTDDVLDRVFSRFCIGK